MFKESLVLYFLLFISGCIIIYLSRKLSDVKSLIEKDIQKELINKWDEDFVNLVANYGSVSNYIDAHKTDYDIYRSNVLIYISRLKGLSTGVDKAINIIIKKIKENSYLDNKMLLMDMEMVKEALMTSITEVADDATVFVENEEEAHRGDGDIEDILNNLSKEIKEVNLYEQKKD